MGHIAEDQWEFYSVSLANALLGFSDSNAARQLAAAFRAAMTPKALMFMLPLSLVRLEWQIPEWRN